MSKPIPAKEACRLLGGISRATFVRYARDGKLSPAWQNGGPRGPWFTTLEAIEGVKHYAQPPEDDAPQYASAEVLRQLKELHGIG